MEERQNLDLRPEARPLQWRQLVGAQRAAFRDVVARLAASGDRLELKRKDSDRQPGLPRLDPDRESRLVMLSGVRGSGKTTVLLTLMRAFAASTEWHSEVQDLAKELTRISADDRDRSELAALVTDYLPIKTNLENLRQQVVWLKTLDLEPLPAPTNLLAAILDRVQLVAEEFGAHGRRAAGAAARPLAFDNYDEALVDLHRLRSNVALAWDGNLRERGGHLDPDQYAAEVMRAERARSTLTDELATVFDRLGDELQARVPHRFTRSPLFILPVDDVDLNPVRCIELLQLLRMISTPRLFVIVLGDIETTELIMRLHLAEQLAGVAGAASRGDFLPPGDRQLVGKAGELASNALRKLIPPAQRAELHRLTVNEALEFRPLGHETKLRELLASIPVGPAYGEKQILAGHSIKTLEDFLTGGPGSRTFPPNTGYRGVNALRLPLRHVTDLWMRLDRLRADFERLHPEQASVALFRAIGGWLRNELAEDPRLSLSARQRAQAAVDVEADEPTLTTSPFKRSDRTGSGVNLRLETRRFPLRAIREDDLYVVEQNQNEQLSSSTRALLFFYHDLLASRDIYRHLFDSHLTPGAMEQACVGWEGGPVVFWYPPAWRTSWEVDRFRMTWNDSVRKAMERIQRFAPSVDRDRDLVRYLVYVWMSTSLALCEHEDKVDPRDLDPQTHSSPDRTGRSGHGPWERLIERYVALINQVNTAQSNPGQAEWADRTRQNLCHVATLLAPEFGLPDDEVSVLDQIAYRFVFPDEEKRKIIADFWSKHAEWIKTLRRACLPTFMAHSQRERAEALFGVKEQEFYERLRKVDALLKKLAEIGFGMPDAPEKVEALRDHRQIQGFLEEINNYIVTTKAESDQGAPRQRARYLADLQEVVDSLERDRSSLDELQFHPINRVGNGCLCLSTRDLDNAAVAASNANQQTQRNANLETASRPGQES